MSNQVPEEKFSSPVHQAWLVERKKQEPVNPQPISDYLIDPLALAVLFHVTYEKLAPQKGYETRKETRVFDPESANGKLMIATCAAIQAAIRENQGS